MVIINSDGTMTVVSGAAEVGPGGVEYFVEATSPSGVAVPVAGDGDTWRMALAGDVGSWVPVRMTYYPLWRVEAAGERLEKRRGADDILEVRLTQPQQTVTLRYSAGIAEILGLAVTVAALVASTATAWKTR